MKHLQHLPEICDKVMKKNGTEGRFFASEDSYKNYTTPKKHNNKIKTTYTIHVIKN